MTVPPRAFLTALNSCRSPRTQVKRRWGPIRTLNGLGGAGLQPGPGDRAHPAHRTPTRPATCRGPRSVARTPRTISAGTVARSSSASASSWAPVGSGRGTHSWSGGATGIGSGEVSNRTVTMSTPETPSTSAWWVLDSIAKRSSAEPLDQPHLPQRPRAVQRLREHPSGQALELGLVAGAGQGRVADVEGDVEVRVVDPHRPALIERHEGQPLAVARHEMQPAGDLRPPARRRSGASPSNTMQPATCMCAASRSRCRKELSSPVRRSGLATSLMLARGLGVTKLTQIGSRSCQLSPIPKFDLPNRLCPVRR